MISLGYFNNLFIVNPVTGDIVGMQPKNENTVKMQPTKAKSGTHHNHVQTSHKNTNM